jgi:uncharacterized protein DUF4411
VQVWIIDTSSIIELRHVPREVRDHVLAALDGLVSSDLLYYPTEVLKELERHDEKSDVAYTWAKKNAAKATRYGQLYVQAKAVLATIPNLIDPDKVSAVDPADPYVIALAQCLVNDGHTPTVITDDIRTSPKKTSLSAGAGAFGFPAVPLFLFLRTQRIWPAS